MNKLWDKGYKMDEFIELFETKDDLELDQNLVLSDCICSMTHAMMLEKIGILTQKELVNLKKGLKEIIELDDKNQFKLKFGDEDIHTKIENYLTQKYGDVGKKIHTGRSRNDQVLSAIRFFSKEELLMIWQLLLDVIVSFQQFSQKYEFVLMPGYTHMQKAMPSTIGMWMGSFTEGFMDDLIQLKTAYDLNNQSVLGSGPGYGMPISIEREYVAKLSGFKKVMNNSLYCQNSKGKIEGIILSSLISILYDVNKFASDILLFTTSEFSYFDVTENLCSGSSAMPQKKNIDIAELLRSKIHLVLGNYTKIISMSSNLISGYNRDLQDIKKPLFESLEITKDSLKALNLLVKNLKPKEDVLKKALTPELFATHAAYKLVKKDIPFREAYKKISQSLDKLPEFDFKEIIEESNHLGGLGNLGLEESAEKIEEEKEVCEKENNKFQKVIKSLMRENYEAKT